jgi:hypothetical protein
MAPNGKRKTVIVSFRLYPETVDALKMACNLQNLTQAELFERLVKLDMSGRITNGPAGNSYKKEILLTGTAEKGRENCNNPEASAPNLIKAADPT